MKFKRIIEDGIYIYSDDGDDYVVESYGYPDATISFLGDETRFKDGLDGDFFGPIGLGVIKDNYNKMFKHLTSISPRKKSSEAASYIGCSEYTLRASRSTGILLGVTSPEFIKIGRSIFYSEDSLNRWIKNNSTAMAITSNRRGNRK